MVWLLVLQLGTLSAQSPAHAVYDRVILGGRVLDPASKLDAVRNIGLQGGRSAVITTHAVRGRDTVDARGLVVAPGFIDLHAPGQRPETYRFYAPDGVMTALELELTFPHGCTTSLLGAGLERADYRNTEVPGFDYTFVTASFFGQTTLTLTQRIAISASGRCDAHSRYPTICSPRLSVLLPEAMGVTARLSAATGFSAPTPLTEETVVIGLSRLRPLMDLRPAPSIAS